METLSLVSLYISVVAYHVAVIYFVAMLVLRFLHNKGFCKLLVFVVLLIPIVLCQYFAFVAASLSGLSLQMIGISLTAVTLAGFELARDRFKRCGGRKKTKTD